MATIIPVILEERFDDIVEKIRIAEKRAKIIQIDIADGILVNGLTFPDLEKIGQIRSSAELEIHLMVTNPVIYLQKRYQSITRMVSQVETDYTDSFIKEARRLEYKVGLSLEINTNISDMSQYIDYVDYIQFIGVEAGGQGRKIEPLTLEKMTLFKREHPNKEMQIDGGVTLENIGEILKTGVNNVVIGSALFGSEDFNKTFNKFREIVK